MHLCSEKATQVLQAWVPHACQSVQQEHTAADLFGQDEANLEDEGVNLEDEGFQDEELLAPSPPPPAAPNDVSDRRKALLQLARKAKVCPQCHTASMSSWVCCSRFACSLKALHDSFTDSHYQKYQLRSSPVAIF